MYLHHTQEYGKLSWDGKRDQWAGYRPEDHERVIERCVGCGCGGDGQDHTES